MQLNKSRQGRVCNPQLVAEWNQTVGLYGINPKERYTLRVMPYACGNYILAHARLHTNPSDWIEKITTCRKVKNDCYLYTNIRAVSFQLVLQFLNIDVAYCAILFYG